MSWETAAGAEPTRQEELQLIDSYKRSFREQSLTDLTQNDALRLRIMQHRDEQTAPYRRAWRRNFLLGTVIGGFIFVPVGFLRNKTCLGVPTHFVPKVYTAPLSDHPHFYRRWKFAQTVVPLVLATGWVFAQARTSVRPIADEYLTARRPIVPH